MLVVRTRQLTTEDFHLIRRAALSAAPTTGLVDTACQTINLATSCRNDKLSDRNIHRTPGECCPSSGRARVPPPSRESTAPSNPRPARVPPPALAPLPVP